MIYRFDSPLLFLNCSRFKSCAIELVARANSELKTPPHCESALHVEYLVLDTYGFNYMDSMGAAALKDLAIELKKKHVGVQLLVASAKGSIDLSIKTLFSPATKDVYREWDTFGDSEKLILSNYS